MKFNSLFNRPWHLWNRKKRKNLKMKYKKKGFDVINFVYPMKINNMSPKEFFKFYKYHPVVQSPR